MSGLNVGKFLSLISLSNTPFIIIPNLNIKKDVTMEFIHCSLVAGVSSGLSTMRLSENWCNNLQTGLAHFTFEKKQFTLI
jgi:hypothetical protein